MARMVVITGGGTGIGRAAAGAFARGGDRVVIVGRRLDVLKATAADLNDGVGAARVVARSCDVTKVEEVEMLAEWLRNDAGRVDVLVNNAGGVGPSAGADTLADAASRARAVLDLNVVGAYLMVRGLQHLFTRPGGRIVNLTSIAAFRGGGDIYAAAKAAVVGLTYSLASEFGAQGITVNAVAPGLTLDTEFFGAGPERERLERAVSQTPLGRAGRPDDVAVAIHHLASPDASFITGEVAHVNGGWLFGR